jgi:17beta-estradiol 17-dehydrogenase / very-long-chain 3-oxoacyl-CoA reductase
MDIVLISRSPQKLKNVKEEIELTFKVNVLTVFVDFTERASAYVPRIKEALRNLEIGILVNNVGMTETGFNMFLELNRGIQAARDNVNVNIVSMNEVTRIVLPRMIERRKGAVINLSSITTEFNIKTTQLYVSTKAYINKFTDGLEQEYAKYGLVFQRLQPGQVFTNLGQTVGFEERQLLTSSVHACVKSSLGALGTFNKTFGTWRHGVVYFFLESLVLFLPSAIMEYLFSLSVAIYRKRAVGHNN